MDITILLCTSLTLSSILLIIYQLSSPKRSHHRLPPSPATALPILGHLHLLKQPLHRNLHLLSQTCGPIFSLKLGFRRCVVVTSPELVDECFTKNDVVLADRPRLMIDKYVVYNHTGMSGAPYGTHWRHLRRIAAQVLLSSTRLNDFRHIRKDEINCLLSSLHNKSRGFSKVVLRPKLSELTFNVMTRMIAGKRYFSSKDNKESDEGQRFRKLINQVFELAQASNPQDFLPFLQWIDYGGFRKKMVSLGEQMDDFFQSLVDDHRQEKRDTMIGNLLSLVISELNFGTQSFLAG